MYRVHLTEPQRRALTARARTPELAARTRERLEMVRLADAGWSIPRIAQHFQRSEPTVRTWIKRFLAGGLDALPDQPHPGQTSQLTPALLAAIRDHLRASPRTWTAAQLAAWLAAEHGLSLSPEHLGDLLRRAGITYHRTSRSLKHKQDPLQVAEQQADLETLEKGAPLAGWTSTMQTRPASR